MYDNSEIKKDFQGRTRIIFVIVFLLSGVLVYNLFILQICNSHKYFMLSDKNRIRLSPILPKRGRIVTSDGKIVAKSKRQYKLVLETCEKSLFLNNMDIIGSCIDISDKEKQVIIDMRERLPRYAPIIIKDGLSWEEYAKIAMIFFKLNHVSVDNIFIRDYEMPYAFSHVIGYVSKSNDNLQILTGKTGLEEFFNDELVGQIGNVQTEINAVGKKMRVLDSLHPIDGKDVVITINSELQKYVYDLISVEKAGACLVLDISNGHVIAMVSVPGFDTNLIASKITQKQWNKIVDDKLCPLMNRVVHGLYPPGSIFKIVVAFAALCEGIMRPSDTVFCSGSMMMDNHTFHCVNRRGHGKVNIYDAIRFSCDCYFFEVAKRLGIDTIVKYAKKFGFGKHTGIEITNESSGLLPSRTWKVLKYGSSWKPYETVLIGIGQGTLLTTLLQTATMFGKIYSGNYAYSPTLIKESPYHKKMTIKDTIDNPNINVIKNALYQVCNMPGGTAFGSCQTDYGISGKTGSSQVRRLKANEVGLVNQESIPWKYRDHAFFTGCAPHNNPRYIVAVLIEHGGWGSRSAAPIARKIFDQLMSMKSAENK